MLECIFEYEGSEDVEPQREMDFKQVKDSEQQDKPVEGIGTLAKENLSEMPNVEKIEVEQVSFTGKYNETEIKKLENNVSNCKSEVGRLKSEVHH